MDLRRLGFFLAVADHGGFTAAARAVRVAQPAVSLGIRELEHELGAELFIRSRSGAVLTAAGRALLEPARQAVRDIDVAAAAVAAVTGLVAGRLDLASLPTLAADPLAPFVGRFRQAHPAVAVHLLAPTDVAGLTEAVRAGVAEIGITEGGSGARAGGLEQHPISDQELMAVSPPGSAAGRSGVTLRALAARSLVLTDIGTSVRDVLERAFAEGGLEPIVAVETAQRDAVIPLVLAGAGTAVLPKTLAGAAGALGAVVERIRPALRRSVVLVHRPGVLSPAAARFVDLAVGGARRG
jgi:DNA-binding transcriptional LysR family regulator